MNPSPSPPPSDIPVLPGHYRRTFEYFLRCWLGMAAGTGVFALGLKWNSIIVQIIGGVIAFVAFLWMFRTFARANSAPCPNGSTPMSLGWDAKKNQSDGVFVCPDCKSSWRTRAVWGFE